MNEKWVVVPVEPTNDMGDSAGRAVNESRWHCQAVYRAMLAARPTGPEVPILIANPHQDCALHGCQLTPVAATGAPKLLIQKTEAEWREEYESWVKRQQNQFFSCDPIAAWRAALRLVGAIKE